MPKSGRDHDRGEQDSHVLGRTTGIHDPASVHISEIAAASNERALQYAQEFLRGGRKDGRHWRCSNAWGGNGGSFYLNINGRLPGKWRDEADGSHGDVMDLFVLQAGGDKQR